MSKVKIIVHKSEQAVMQERLFLSTLKNKFIVNMLCSFQDSNNLYLGLELMKGGDLRYHLMNYSRIFTESQLKFLLTNIIMGLEHIHSQNIIHRDLKPENILFDNIGYAYITDFNISCKKEEINKNNYISGTPVYMAPEAIFQERQDFTIDFYSLGIMAYECLIGQRPYEGNSHSEVKQILNEENIAIENDGTVSDLCRNLINGLLAKEPNNRLGSQYGISELKENPFFRGFNWDFLKRRKYVSPITQIINYSKSKNRNFEELFDENYCNKNEEISENEKNRYSQIINNENYSNYFRQYTFININAIKGINNKNTNNINLSAPPKKSIRNSKSSQNMLPRLNTGNNNPHLNSYQSNILHYQDHIPNQKYRFQSLERSHDYPPPRDHVPYKRYKYRRLLLRPREYCDYYDDYRYPNLFESKNQRENFRQFYSSQQGNMDGSEIYSSIVNNIHNKLYGEILGGLNLGKIYVKKKRRYGFPNSQFQINNYFPPSCMMHGMCMGNPCNFMMNPFQNQNPNLIQNPPPPNNNVLPNIYTKKPQITYKYHHHRDKTKNGYSKSSYVDTKSIRINLNYKNSERSKNYHHYHHHKTKTEKSRKKSSEHTKKSKKSEKSKKSGKSKKSEKSKKSNKSKNSKKSKKEQSEEDKKGKKDKKKKTTKEEEEEDGDEDKEEEEGEGEENEDEENEDDGKKKKKKKGKGGDDEEEEGEGNEEGDEEGEEKEDEEGGGEDEEGGEGEDEEGGGEDENEGGEGEEKDDEGNEGNEEEDGE